MVNLEFSHFKCCEIYLLLNKSALIVSKKVSHKKNIQKREKNESILKDFQQNLSNTCHF